MSAPPIVRSPSCALALNVARKPHAAVALRVQVTCAGPVLFLQLEPERAIEVLPSPFAKGGRAEGVAEAGARDRQRGRPLDRGRTRPPGPAVAGAGRADREQEKKHDGRTQMLEHGRVSPS